MDWKQITNEKEKYAAYLAGREWGLLRGAVHVRANGVCERCKANPIDAVHHLTYIRKYKEELADLQGICNDCHDFTHGRSDYDPLAPKERLKQNWEIALEKKRFNGVDFEDVYHCLWAGFLDLAGWDWVYKPGLRDCDFVVKFKCTHWLCKGSHTVLFWVRDHKRFASNDFGCGEPIAGGLLSVDGPEHSTWWMGHGENGGGYTVNEWAKDSAKKFECAKLMAFMSPERREMQRDTILEGSVTRIRDNGWWDRHYGEGIRYRAFSRLTTQE